MLLDLHHQSTGTIFLSPASHHDLHHHDLHQRVAIGVVVLLMLLLLKLRPSKIVNASASTNVSYKDNPMAPAGCRTIDVQVDINYYNMIISYIQYITSHRWPHHITIIPCKNKLDVL